MLTPEEAEEMGKRKLDKEFIVGDDAPLVFDEGTASDDDIPQESKHKRGKGRLVQTKYIREAMLASSDGEDEEAAVTCKNRKRKRRSIAPASPL